MSVVPRLIHLNGAPGVGKSTLSRRYGADHPGVLICDIDVLRTMVAGWEGDFHEAGARIRSAALAGITAYLASGHDVVVPQLVGRASELDRFRAAALAADAAYVGVLLTATPDVVVERFRERTARAPEDPLVRTVTDVVEGLGGDSLLIDTTHALEDLATEHHLLRVIASDLESTYAALLRVLGETTRGQGNAGVEDPGPRST